MPINCLAERRNALYKQIEYKRRRLIRKVGVVTGDADGEVADERVLNTSRFMQWYLESKHGN